MEYLPAFIWGDVYCPSTPAVVQYCEALFDQWRTVWKPWATPVAVPDTIPRPLLETYPWIERDSKKEVSRPGAGFAPVLLAA
jgi:hypothetical protein